MRNPERIRPFLRALESVWMQHPDQRFGQLVMNLSREPGGFADTWNWEDGDWRRRMDAYPHPVAADDSGGSSRLCQCEGIDTGKHEPWCRYQGDT